MEKSNFFLRIFVYFYYCKYSKIDFKGINCY